MTVVPVPLDTNLDPSSTMQLVDALIRAGKDFELLVTPNGGHGAMGADGNRRRAGVRLLRERGRPRGEWWW